MRNNSNYFVWLVFISLILMSCGEKQPKKQEKKKDYKEFQTVKAEPAEIQNTLNLTGRIVPIQKVDIIAEVQGRAQNMRKTFKEGTSFRKGELLLSLDDNKFRYNLNAQKSQFVSALVNAMADVQLDYPNEFPKWNTFLQEIDVEKSLPTLPEATNQQLKNFLNDKNIYNLYYTIKSQEETLRDYRIYAPFSGSVTMAMIDAGDLVRPGAKLGEFIRTDVYEVKAAVTANDIKEFEVGQEVELYVRNIDRKVMAKIKRLGTSVDAATQAVNVFLEVPGEGLKEGMYVESNFVKGAFNNAIEVDKHLISRENRIYVIKDSTVVAKQIEVLQTKESKSIITGLEKGDQMITEKTNNPIAGIKAVPKA
ncbi:efflux RND transporter periplasmic adaptor subunit [Aquimarina celericrescens]|uniref:Efflux RND transporter periplasmic adaptor subunit n=1 Tax=Aquimarina celericrescens TaxID=1964542 RepID=A0ABW5AVY7_9FLAO|nr:HlyD family efflux transporter periplasmic adaptor subunit [Aquimarina celericrescens]